MKKSVTITKELLVKLLDYVQEDEQRHYEECEEDCIEEELHSHIYTTIMALRAEIK